MGRTVADIAEALGAEAAGDLSVEINRPAHPAAASEDDLAMAMEPSYAAALTDSPAKAAIIWADADWQALGLTAAIFAPRSRYVMAGVTRIFDIPRMLDGVHETAVIHPSANIGQGAAVGPFVVIGADVRIGANVRIFSHVSIAEGAVIGDDALILEGARVGARVHIGDRLIAQPGCVIGADGFSFVTPTPGAVEEARETGQITAASRTDGFARINSLGSVRIGDDVEIGANAAIDRGTLADTTIGSGTKIDNLVQIGHNVTIGSTCLLCGQAGVAGSAKVGDRVVLGGAAGLADHITVGSDTVIAGKSGVASNVPPGSIMMGYPAMPMARNVEAYREVRRLPRLAKKLADLEKRVSKLDGNG